MLYRRLARDNDSEFRNHPDEFSEDSSTSDSYWVTVFQADSEHGNNRIVKVTLAAKVPGGEEYIADEDYNIENDYGDDNEYCWKEANVDPNVLNEKALKCLRDFLSQQYSSEIPPTMENLTYWSYNGYDTEYPLKMNVTIELPEAQLRQPQQKTEASVKKRRLYGYNSRYER